MQVRKRISRYNKYQTFKMFVQIQKLIKVNNYSYQPPQLIKMIDQGFTSHSTPITTDKKWCLSMSIEQ